tara:strand:+ start:11002 stop:12228 length:1227 start_codon:yes stop_codon:yes gene_type:complete
MLASVASSAATTTLKTHDAACNDNGYDAGMVSFNGGSYLSCELPTSIAVGANTIVLAKQNGSGTNIVWTLTDITTVGNGHVQNTSYASADKTELEIEAGAHIAGTNPPNGSALVITRGATIKAIGSAMEPIVFSSLDDNFTGNDEWGGLIVSGYGQSNQCPSSGSADTCVMEGVNSSFYYGGGLDLQTSVSSGTLQYVVIAEGGHVLATDSEINGLTLYAVNDDTTINNIHVHNNLDDGVEFFGGDADVSNLWLTCNNDDSVDWDEGYTGNLTNISITQGENAGHAFELANNPNSPYTQSPVAKGIINNVSLFFDGITVANVPFKLKQGTDASFTNVNVASAYDGSNCDETSTAIELHSGSAFNTIEYGCTAVNANAGSYMDLPASSTATGFTTASFWSEWTNSPSCD